MNAHKIGGSNAAHEAPQGATGSLPNLAPRGGDAARGSFADVDAAYAAGVAAGREMATREMLVRLNQMRVDLAAGALGGARLLGNSEGVGAVPFCRDLANRAGR